MLTDKSIRRLHSALCNDFGFSLDVATVADLAGEHAQDELRFTEAIIRAEGLDPEMVDRHLYRRLRQVIREAEIIGAG